MIGRTACVIAAVLLAAGAATAGTPRGPAFGNNQFRTMLTPVGGVADSDDFVASLRLGEKLTVTVDGPAGLHGTLVLVDPAGNVIDPGAAMKKGGRKLILTRYDVPATGRWTVRVGSADVVTVSYKVKFKIAPPPKTLISRLHLGGALPNAAVHAFEAIDDSSLALLVQSKGTGAPVTVNSLTIPSGGEVTRDPADFVPVKNRVNVKGIHLGGGDGTYRLGVGIAAGEAEYSVRFDVRSPQRRKGKVELSGDEPFLAALASPIDGTAGQVIQLSGKNFKATLPRPDVFFGTVHGSVTAATATTLNVVPPSGTDDAVVDITVVNPDGQAFTRTAYFHYVPPVPPDVLKIEPAPVVIEQGAQKQFTVTLNRKAPSPGVDVTLATTNSIGTAPASVHVAEGALTASFQFTAAASPAAGKMNATLAATVFANVTVVPPAPPVSLTSLTPNPAQVLENAVQSFTLTLSGATGPAGLDVLVAATGGIGTVPPLVHVPGLANSVQFDLIAAASVATGTITATAGNGVQATVNVVAPATIDVSGWSMDQANSARTFTIPAGTVLHAGDYLIVGRNATKSQFEAFWGVTLGPNVVYFNGLDQWPTINGDETYALRNLAGGLVDGPTVGQPSSAGSIFRRTPGTPAGLAGSWTVSSASTPSNGNPGSGQVQAAAPVGVYISEFADALGSGNFIYEFVELYFDRLP